MGLSSLTIIVNKRWVYRHFHKLAHKSYSISQKNYLLLLNIFRSRVLAAECDRENIFSLRSFTFEIWAPEQVNFIWSRKSESLFLKTIKFLVPEKPHAVVAIWTIMVLIILITHVDPFQVFDKINNKLLIKYLHY